MRNWLRRLLTGRDTRTEENAPRRTEPISPPPFAVHPSPVVSPPTPQTTRPTPAARPIPPTNSPSLRVAPAPPVRGRISWGTSEPRAANLLEALDPILMTPLRPGERIHVCQRCQTGYHVESFAFIRTENSGACVGCRLTDQFIVMVLPAVGGTIEAPPKHPSTRSANLVTLSKVRNFIGQVVDFEGEVVKVHRSRQGTYFVKFEHTERPFDGFNLVVFNRYEHAWLTQGLTPLTYESKRIRVHGLVNEHPTWGIQIIVNTPDVVVPLPSGSTKTKVAWKDF